MKSFVDVLIKDMVLSHDVDLTPYLNHDGSKRQSNLSYWSFFWRYFFADFMFSYTVVTMAVVGFWRGTWDYSTYYLDKLVFNGKKYQSLIFVFTVGFCGIQIIQTCHSMFKKYSLAKKFKLNYRINSKVFSIFWGIMDIYLWRGIWELLDMIFLQYTISLKFGCITLTAGVIVLTITKSFRSSLSLPNGIALDDESNRIYASTYYETNADSDIFHILTDSFFSTLLEGFVVAAWHGIWTIADNVSYNSLNLTHSAAGSSSYVIGFICGCICLYAQFPLYEKIWINPQRSNFLKYATNFFFTFLELISTVLTFRGVWYIWDSYFLADNWHASLILSQILGGLILFSINCGSCLHAGIVKDLYNADGLIIPYHYFTYYYSRELAMRYDEEEGKQESESIN